MAGDTNARDTKALEDLFSVIDTLLGPDGCPWDREQTPDSLCDYLAEETFELIDAIRGGSVADVREELGDVLFVLLHLSRLYGENFSLADGLNESAAKMIRRHPHVFADASCENREDLLRTWEAVKKQEKAAKSEDADSDGKKGGVFTSLPRSLPPMLKSYRIHSKAARAGFTWDSDEDVEMQAEAEWLELLDVCRGDDTAKQEHELGDLLFTLVELGRRKGLKANAALDKTALRFLRRFAYMEEKAAERGLEFASLDMDVKNELWDEAKEQEKVSGAES
ncbi:nucleoside triphosphate pyrophosphohydrolase [Desulfovibrio sp. OttesenSCG-928-I05]|nr:nucleoside triphosphate pyrophosphohydrolase [Desulfovibrio sp. OttesenSCG-928-I05]